LLFIAPKTTSKVSHNAEPQKSVKFSPNVDKLASKKQEEKVDETLDSDDEGDVATKSVSQSGVVTITESDDSKEVISNHVTKSAVKLATKSLVYELDDDV